MAAPQYRTMLKPRPDPTIVNKNRPGRTMERVGLIGLIIVPLLAIGYPFLVAFMAGLGLGAIARPALAFAIFAAITVLLVSIVAVIRMRAASDQPESPAYGEDESTENRWRDTGS